MLGKSEYHKLPLDEYRAEAERLRQAARRVWTLREACEQLLDLDAGEGHGDAGEAADPP
jgi:hypothetical protein